MSLPSQKGDHKPKPCKVWDSTRMNRKSLVAKDLTEFILEGKRKLNIPTEENIKVVLEEDGTEVDENEYFRLVPDFSTFLLLREQELWLPHGCTVSGNRRMFAEWDPRRPSIGNDSASGSTCSDNDVVDSGSNTTKDRAIILFEQLCSGNAYKQLLPWLLLRPLDLEEIINAKPDDLVAASGIPRNILDTIQEMAHKALADYNSAQKAIQMLSIYDQAINHNTKQK